MSYMSEEALSGLVKTSCEIEQLEARIDEIVANVRSGQLIPGQARTELSQVEAAANKVECNKIDSIYTSELNSGKAQAKDEKKEQLKRLEALFAKLEAQFQWLKTLDV